MKTRKIALLTALLLCLSACGSSVPEQDAPVVASAAVTSDGGDTESPAEPKPDAGEKSLLPSDAPLAEAEDVAAGALMVSLEAEGKGVGSVGCTAVRHAYRGRRFGRGCGLHPSGGHNCRGAQF